MSRLIDADEFEKFIQKKYKDGEKTDDIKDQLLFDLSYQPTAYDTDRVVYPLKECLKGDVCEWKKGKENWESSCDYLIEENWFYAIFHATIDEYYCPYCGKKIKVVE